MALDPNYGTRISGYAQEAFPQAYAPVPQPNVEGVGGAAPGAAAGPTGPTGFPKLVLDTQGEGPKLDKDTLGRLKERYKTETLFPREWTKKGSKQGTVDAASAAFDSK